MSEPAETKLLTENVGSQAPESRQGLPSISGYEVLGELGSGGMGVVYKARQLERDRLVALKVLPLGRHANFLQLARFRIEAEAVACLAHPNIIRIHGIGVHAGCPFLAFQLAEGGSLSDRLKDGRQPVRWAAETTLTMAQALRHAHERGILHRDLKPANVLFLADGTLKITDFGLAKFTRPIAKVSDEYCTKPGLPFDRFLRVEAMRDEHLWKKLVKEHENSPDPGRTFEEFAAQQLWHERVERLAATALDSTASTRTITEFTAEARQQSEQAVPRDMQSLLDGLTQLGEVMGTPRYMAPEQINGDIDRIGPGTDIYAVGVLLYQMLTRRFPFVGSNMLQLLHAQKDERPASLGPFVPRPLGEICMKCLKADVDQRYPTASDLIRDLERFLVLDPPRSRKWWQIWK
jgi:serine/threonine protein kinase